MDGDFLVNQPKPQGKDIECVQCGGMYFVQVMSLKLFSKLEIGAPKDALAPDEVVLRCFDCGTILDPEDLSEENIIT